MSHPYHATPQFSLLTRDQCEAVHHASLEILRRTGVRVDHPRALALLLGSDAVVETDGRVRFPPALIEWALAGPPSAIALCKRGTSEAAARLEGREVHFGTGSACPNYLDPRNGERRPFTQADVIACVKLVDALPEIDFCMSMGLPSNAMRMPSEPDAGETYVDEFALMLEHTSKPLCFTLGSRAENEAIVAMAAAAAGGLDELRMNPTLLGYGQPTTPLIHGEDSTDKLLFMAEMGLPIVYQASPMMGGSAPMSMAAGLALGNAEMLSGLVIHQLARRGAPFMYGCGAHHMDMRTTIAVYGAPEFELARAAVTDMARYYNLPHFGYAGYTDSCAVDGQAASDATSSIFVALLTGQHLVHDIGYIEAGLTVSPEMIVFCADTIGRLRHFTAGFDLSPDAFCLDLIHAAGAGGSFLTSDHTLQHFREFWQPALYSRLRRDDWLKRGGKDLGQRLRDRTVALMERSKGSELPPGSLAEVERIRRAARAEVSA
jgi:trimethylamine---corrinoid protein Co-methyltransferase